MPVHPSVTILMAVHNGERYLRQAMDSILSQTWTDFEFLIIDDGSHDRSVDIITAYHDPRIRLIHNTTNMGLAVSLNRGLACARGTYIVRMDSDDISMPQRIEQQVAYMECHPDVGICGCRVQTITTEGTKQAVWNYPTDPDRITSTLLFHSVIVHPSVIMRREILRQAGLCYNATYARAQDYDLWARASQHMCLANMADILLHYRVYPFQERKGYREEQQVWANRVRQFQIERTGLCPTQEELATHAALSTWKQAGSLWAFQPERAFVMRAESWLCKLLAANRKHQTYPEPAFSQVLAETWFGVCATSTRLGVWSWLTFWRSPFSRMKNQNRKHVLKFALKSLLSRDRARERL